MQDRLKSLKSFITEKSSDPEFVHHGWFAEWHLEIVERIAEELLRVYPEANADVVRAMVWMHDYGKIVDFDNQYEHEYVDKGRDELVRLGFEEDFADTVASNIKTLDAKDNLAAANIETRIVSSADGCSHLVGPFIRLYWWENSSKPYEEIMAENVRKLTVDWDKKVVLPEARSAFQSRHDIAIEQSGDIKSVDFVKPFIVASVNFYSSDIDRSIDFYTKTLGIELVDRQGDSYASFALNDELRLGVKLASEEREKPGSQTLILRVPDINTAYDLAIEQGADVLVHLRDDPWGQWFAIGDPDGNMIEYLQTE